MACNLQVDPSGTADLTGPSGKSVTVGIAGTTGKASIVGAIYAGKKITAKPPTFTILAGDNMLDLMIDNNVSGDVTVLSCADGTVLERFRFDRNNPAILLDVRGV